MFYKFKICKDYIIYISGAVLLVSLIVLMYFSFLKMQFLTQTNNICIADFVDCLGKGSIKNTIFIPLISIIISIISEHNNTCVNYYIRHEKRRAIVIKKTMRSFIIAIILVGMFMCNSVFIAGLFTDSFINWDSYFSLYYLSNGITNKINFISVVAIVFSKYFYTIMFYLVLANAVSVLFKKWIAFLIVVFLSAMDLLSFIQMIIEKLFGRFCEHIEYMSIDCLLTIYLILPLLTILIVFITTKLFDRKDILNT